MKVLLDTNIVIHREAKTAIDPDIGPLFNWLDTLQHKKCIHPITVSEIEKYKDPKTVNTLSIKLSSYNVLKTQAPLSPTVMEAFSANDRDENDRNDTILLNELHNDRVDILISEDKKIHQKASILGLSDRVFTIDSFLEKVTSENPSLADYKVLSVKKEHFGALDIGDPFFRPLKQDYPDFIRWYNRKADEIAYVCKSGKRIIAFLYLKIEREKEDYSDITPVFSRKKRLKIGTFKVDANGYKLGERFLKIVFDNALRLRVDEIYVTIYDRRLEQQRLINLLGDYGFSFHGYKKNDTEDELVYVRDFSGRVNTAAPKTTFPFVSSRTNPFLVAIYPDYHTSLLPDSILRTESPHDFVENEPFRNAISKVFISRSHEKNLHSGDIIIFYRTGGKYKGVITTLGIVEDVITGIRDEGRFIQLCGKRSVFTERELHLQWNYYPKLKPFIVNFLYAYSFPKRLTLDQLINLGVTRDINSAPRGFVRISFDRFLTIMRETQSDASIIVD